MASPSVRAGWLSALQHWETLCSEHHPRRDSRVLCLPLFSIPLFPTFKSSDRFLPAQALWTLSHCPAWRQLYQY